MLKRILSFIVLVVVVLISVSYFQNKNYASSDFGVLNDRDIVEINIRNQETAFSQGNDLRVEVVNTPASTAQGLSGRDEIGQDGMLFIFPDSSMRNFWMKEMKFDLDIVWINGNQVIKISKGVLRPDPDTPVENLPLISSGQPTDKVLELNSGDADRLNIQVGNVVVLKK